MAPSRAPSMALLRSLRSAVLETNSTATRTFTTTFITRQDIQQETSTCPPDPVTITAQAEQQATSPPNERLAGSRRRRAALQETGSIPFDALPYQCFQEARQILIADRAEKIKQIELERGRLEKLRSTDPSTFRGGVRTKQMKIGSMERHLEKLKIYADINDPNVKRRFEDGRGDLNKPIYRYLADRKWREYRRKVQVQRIETMKVVPDVVPECELELDIGIMFNRKTISPGAFVESNISEQPPQLSIQSFKRGERLLTIAVIDPDVPNVETDLFDSRCHFLATNIVISPTSPLVDFAKLSDQQVILPWMPPHAQKGSPYHRLAIVILEQNGNAALEKEALAQRYTRETFNIRTALTRHPVRPIGAALFRTKWDDSMLDVMARNGFEGANVELKRKKVEPLPYKRRNPSSFR